MTNYRKRIADALLAEKLSYMGAVLVQGPKWCGKTTTSRQAVKSEVSLEDSVKGRSNRILAQTRPDRLLEGATPRLIDEWQEGPQLWDAVRSAVDRGGRGMFVLTGSAVPPEVDEDSPNRVPRHSGTGRISRLTMRPMCLWESGDSTGEVSVGSLFAGEDVTGAKSELELEDVCELICRGGWPGALGLSGRVARGPAKEYFEAIVESDISRVDKTLRDPERVRRLMGSLARLQGTQSSAAAICADMRANDSASLTEDTVYSYLKALRRIFVTEDMRAWCPNLRCKTPLRTTDTRYFTDPSIAAAAMGLGPGDLLNDMPTFGLFFEAMAVRDLRTIAEAHGGSLLHYLDKSGLECDAVMRMENGAYGLIEIKTGGEALIGKGVKTLESLSAKIDTTRMPSPSFRMVLVATGNFAYRRKEDGIVVCPIGSLKP
ncbi:MAG: ATP-binding protein [Kiritimatiellae bacterium]|nr:ATP-binding protein [Kiritimatiellia bacterium]